MKKIIALTLTLLMVMMLFTSCGSSGNMDEGYGNNKSESGYTNAGNGSDDAIKDAETVERKVIKTYRIRMETLTYDEATARIVSETERFGGYIANASQDGTGVDSNRVRNASYTVRVPADKADDFIKAISGEGVNVLSSSLDTEDVTDSYYGYQARLDSLAVQEKRLMEMLEKAEYLGDMIQIEDKLSEVRAEINGIHSKLQLMDKSVEYSYIHISIYEVQKYVEPEEETYFARVGASFVNAFKTFAEVIGELFIAFIWVLPYALVATVIAVIVVVFTLKSKKSKKKSNSEEERNDKQ